MHDVVTLDPYEKAYLDSIHALQKSQYQLIDPAQRESLEKVYINLEEVVTNP